jgi:signal transduction histidine kinase
MGLQVDATQTGGSGPRETRPAEEATRRLHETETLLRVGRTITSTLDLNEVARRICREAARAVGADSAGIYLRGGDDILRPLAGYHVPKAHVPGILADQPSVEEFRRLSEFLDRAAGEGIGSDDVPTDPRFDHPIFRRFPVRSVFFTRLATRNERLGVLLCAWWARRRQILATEARVLEGIAAQAAIAIVNARLYAKAEELAVSHERLRVAHELHAALSQSLFSMGLKLEWSLHQVGDDSPLRSKLEDVQRDAAFVMRHIREFLHQLSPEQPAADFADRLEQLVRDFRELSGIPVEFVKHGDVTRLGRPQQETLLRVFQEGFANIVKHARATRVTIWLVVLRSDVEFEVSDDGVGPPAGPPVLRLAEVRGHFGLRQIAERIAEAGGEVEFSKNAAAGFCVRGSLPLQRSGSPDMAPAPPTLGSAPAQPWHSSSPRPPPG